LLAGKNCIGSVSTGFNDNPANNMAGWFIAWGPKLEGKLWRIPGAEGFSNPPQALNAGKGTMEELTRVRSAANGEIAFHRSSDQEVFIRPAGNGGFSIRTGVNAKYNREAKGSMTCK
jgi:hypothetical protein